MSAIKTVTPVYEPVVGAEEVADMLDCSSKTVLRMAKAGQLPGIQIGKLWRFRRSVIDRWIAERLEFPGRPRVAEEES